MHRLFCLLSALVVLAGCSEFVINVGANAGGSGGAGPAVQGAGGAGTGAGGTSTGGSGGTGGMKSSGWSLVEGYNDLSQSFGALDAIAGYYGSVVLALGPNSLYAYHQDGKPWEAPAFGGGGTRDWTDMALVSPNSLYFTTYSGEIWLIQNKDFTAPVLRFGPVAEGALHAITAGTSPDAFLVAVGSQGAIYRLPSGGTDNGMWVKENSQLTETLNDVKLAGSYGLAVGELGVMAASMSGGKVWAPIPALTADGLQAVDVTADFDEDGVADFIAVGNNGAVLRVSSNGSQGEKLKNVPVSTPVRLWDVHSEGDSMCSKSWMVGEKGTILYWDTCGGTGVVALPCPVEDDLTGVYFADDKRGWIITLEGRILKTNNGGQPVN